LCAVTTSCGCEQKQNFKLNLNTNLMSLSAPAARSGQTLEESAREYQAKHDNKVDLKEVEVITGEEDESNVLQVGVHWRSPLSYRWSGQDESSVGRGEQDEPHILWQGWRPNLDFVVFFSKKTPLEF